MLVHKSVLIKAWMRGSRYASEAIRDRAPRKLKQNESSFKGAWRPSMVKQLLEQIDKVISQQNKEYTPLPDHAVFYTFFKIPNRICLNRTDSSSWILTATLT